LTGADIEGIMRFFMSLSGDMLFPRGGGFAESTPHTGITVLRAASLPVAVRDVVQRSYTTMYLNNAALIFLE